MPFDQTVFTPFVHPVKPSPEFSKSVAYFSMEFAIDQSLKTYSGGLGFLAGSHMRSAHDLGQNLIGIGILWKYGYYDQDRKQDNSMEVEFREKIYHFLIDTQIRTTIEVGGQSIWVHAYYLPPEVFKTAPLFFLTTDTEGNDYHARSISYSLYDSNPRTKAVQSSVLGIGGVKILEAMGCTPDVYHFNEAHALPGAFQLYQQYKSVEKVKEHLVFTTHTPEEAGNEKHDFEFLNQLGFFAGLPISTVQEITKQKTSVFNHTLAALRLSRKANGVSRLHGEVARKMWGDYPDICGIDSITNSQNKAYWADPVLEEGRQTRDVALIASRKKELKKELFKTVANQCGKLFDPEVLTIVWARRFTGYKRADLLIEDTERFASFMRNSKYPVQMIWAGKPYPKDDTAIQLFNRLHYLSHYYKNIAVLTGYELALSKLLKDGSDVWLNTPVVTREASGTSGMTAAMNASINCSTFDGWICEFGRNEENAFLIPVAHGDNINQQDRDQLFTMLETTILPMYYDEPEKWQQIILTSMNDVGEYFDSDRMAREYYEKLY